VTPDVLLRVANLTVPRRPDRSPTVYPDPLATPAEAAAALDVPSVAAAELGGLRELHGVVVDLVDRVIDGQPLGKAAERLAALGEGSHARARLEIDEERLRHRLEWTDSTLVSGLARRIVLELGAIDPKRLRRCGRAECDLLFFDGTRSNTQRWHAESPCGQRERQRRHRRRMG
jgi:predicted RNA-binding Zn ribbon-like protein